MFNPLLYLVTSVLKVRFPLHKPNDKNKSYSVKMKRSDPSGSEKERGSTEEEERKARQRRAKETIMIKFKVR